MGQISLDEIVRDDILIRIQKFGNPGGDVIHFNAGVLGGVPHGFRKKANKITHTHARFKYLAARKTHAFKRTVYGPYNLFAGIVGVLSASRGCPYFVIGHDGPKPRDKILPLGFRP